MKISKRIMAACLGDGEPMGTAVKVVYLVGCVVWIAGLINLICEIMS